MRIDSRLVDDFKSWGLTRARRILRMTEKHGVICSSRIYSDKKSG